jgi:hypothetical protein
MPRNSLLYSFLLLISVFSSCKKTGLKDYTLRPPFVKIPEVILDSNFRTYSVELDKFAYDGPDSYSFFQSIPINNVRLQGYNRIPFGGDILIELAMGNGYFYDRGILSIKEKDKQGAEFYRYYRQLEYNNYARYRVIDRNRRILDEIEVQSRNQSGVYKSPFFSSAKECEDWWSRNGNNKVIEIRRDIINASIQQVNTSLDNRYAWENSYGYASFETIKDKKSRDYKPWSKNDEKVKTAFKSLTSYSTTAFIDKITPSITFWEVELSKIRSDDELSYYKKWACLNNLALCYYWMDEFEKAGAYVDLMNQLLVNQNDTKRLENLMEETKYRLERAKLKGQHFALKSQKRGA